MKSHQYVKVNNKFIKYHNKNKESSFLTIGCNNFCGWAMSETFLINCFKWVDIHLNLLKIL